MIRELTERNRRDKYRYNLGVVRRTALREGFSRGLIVGIVGMILFSFVLFFSVYLFI